jgi:hypothetical protein
VHISHPLPPPARCLAGQKPDRFHRQMSAGRATRSIAGAGIWCDDQRGLMRPLNEKLERSSMNQKQRVMLVSLASFPLRHAGEAERGVKSI